MGDPALTIQMAYFLVALQDLKMYAFVCHCLTVLFQNLDVFNQNSYLNIPLFFALKCARTQEIGCRYPKKFPGWHAHALAVSLCLCL